MHSFTAMPKLFGPSTPSFAVALVRFHGDCGYDRIAPRVAALVDPLADDLAPGKFEEPIRVLRERDKTTAYPKPAVAASRAADIRDMIAKFDALRVGGRR